MAKKELWLKNNTRADVHLSDLGVKVGSLKTINVYAYNPYVTEDKVKLSKESGSLFKRLKTNTLRVVKKAVPGRPHTLDQIKVSNTPIEIVKIKTAILIDTKELDVLDDDDLGEIADYGLGDLGHGNTDFAKTSDGAVVVRQKQDDDAPEDPGARVSMEIVESTNMSGQSIVAMTELAEKATNPLGDIAENASSGQSFVVVKPPEVPKTKVKPAVKGKTKVGLTENGAIIVAGTQDKLALPDVLPLAPEPTQDEDGATVMRVKEDAAPAPKARAKAKPAKITKKAKTTKKTRKVKKKASKK